MNNELDNTIGKEASVRDAIELMSKNHTPAVAIVGTDNGLLGCLPTAICDNSSWKMAISPLRSCRL